MPQHNLTHLSEAEPCRSLEEEVASQWELELGDLFNLWCVRLVEDMRMR